MFPVTLIPIAAYKAFLRVQSERSERLRELHEVQGSRELAPWRGPGEQPGQVWAAAQQGTPVAASAAEETSTITWNSFPGNGGMSSGGVTLTTTQDNTRTGDCFYEGRGAATFTAPEGSVFTKIELKNSDYVNSLNLPGATVAQSGSYYDEWEEEWHTLYTVTWTGESSEVTFSGAVYAIQSIVFTLKSSASPTYTVTWKNWDGSVLETDEDVAEGATPEYNGNEPTKPDSNSNTYTFARWTPEVSAVTGDTEYTATFTEASYYIIGTMTNWQVNAAYKLTKNDASEVNKYSYSGLELTTSSQFKVVSAATADGGLLKWFPYSSDIYGANDEITDDAKYTVYFRPDYTGGDDWFCNAIYVAMDVPEESQAVISMIEVNAPPANVTTADAQDIADARAAYAALTDDQKALVSAETLAKLEAAEAALEAATRTYTKYDANDATCSAEGNIEYYVGSDGKFYTDDQGTPLADLNNDGVVDINDTVIATLPHEYVETIVQPKGGEQGYLLHTCSVCQHSYKDNFFDTALKNKSYIETKAQVGETVYLYGDAEGGVAGYTYAFMYRKITTETWTKIGKKYGTATSAKFTPGKATVYEVMINVKDSIGKVKSKTFTIELRTELTNETTVNAETITLGEKIVLKGAASGGTVTPTNGYKYAFYYKKSRNTDWIEIKPAYTTKSASVKPKTAQSYDVKSVVMDNDGNTAEVIYKVNVVEPTES